jgi:hypothetical protein
MDVLALMVAFGALGVSWWAVTQARKSNEIVILAEFLREFRQMEPERRRVIRDLPGSTRARD